MQIRHTATLLYYDGPQIIEARDAIGGHYIGIFTGIEEDADVFLLKGTPPEDLRRFRLGQVDLKGLLEREPGSSWILAGADSESGSFNIRSTSTEPLATTNFLPEAGLFLHEKPTDDIIIEEARIRNSVVLEISVEPPEAASEHRIAMETLALLLFRIKSLMKQAYIHAFRPAPERIQNVSKIADNLWDVVIPAAPGSFRVILESSIPPDLLGDPQVVDALAVVDHLMTTSLDPETIHAHLLEYKGHLAGEYVKLLKFLVKHDTGIQYAWANPRSETPNRHFLSHGQASQLYDILSRSISLSEQELTLSGFLQGADAGGAWKLKTASGDVIGKTRKGGPSTIGLEIGKSYVFKCKEVIKEKDGEEKKETILLAIEN